MGDSADRADNDCMDDSVSDFRDSDSVSSVSAVSFCGKLL